MSAATALGFGRYFTPHMVTAWWSEERAWCRTEVLPHSALQLAPAAMALHYGQAIFEGLKAYLRDRGSSASMFMPWASAARFNHSAERLAMPPFPEDQFVAACEQLVRADLRYVPEDSGTSLYLRPFMIATEPSLGVRASREYLFAIIASPVDSFFAGELRAIDVWCSPDHVRAHPGGTGEAKCAGNYAASLAAKSAALQQDCDEVLWLDAAERSSVEELGAMNFFGVVAGGDGAMELVTPPLSGTILRGNTRQSVLQLARRRRLQVCERRLLLTEVVGPQRTVVEAFACGTAAGIVPIASVTTPDGRYLVGNGRPGPVTMELRDELMAIQEGRLQDDFGWMHEVRAAAETSPVRPSAPTTVRIPLLPSALLSRPPGGQVR